MHILLVVTGFPSISEPARSTFNLIYANELALNHKVTILYLRAINPKRWFINRTKEGNINIVELSIMLPMIGLFNQIPAFSFFFKLFLLFFKFDADIIQGVGGHTSIAAYLLSKKLKKPYFLHFIGGDLNVDIVYFFKNQTFKDSILNCSFSAFESQALELIFDTYFVGVKDKGVIYRGIKLKEYTYHFDYTSEINLLFLGGMPQNTNCKGGLTLMDTISVLDKKAWNVKLRFYIGGPEVPDISAFIKQLSNPNIEVINIGAINKAAVKKYMAKSHIVLIPSESEGLPNVMWEGMATGNMIIASRVGGIPEIINTPDLGILIKPLITEELTEAIMNVVLQPEKIEAYALQARTRVELFDYQSFIDRNMALFSS